MFVKNRKTFSWLTDPVPAMSFYTLPSKIEISPDDDLCSFDYDVLNAAHLEREFGVTQLQLIKATFGKEARHHQPVPMNHTRRVAGKRVTLR